MTELQLGGGLSNQMQALGYSIDLRRYSSDDKLLTVKCPDGQTELWAATEDEAWELASKHWHDTQLAKVSLTPPATQADPLQSRVLTGDMAFPSGQADDALKAELVNLLGDVFDECRLTHINLAVGYILPIIQRETAAAHAAGRAERQAEVVAWVDAMIDSIGDKPATEWCRAQLLAFQEMQRFVAAIERGQHGSKGDE